MDAPKAELMRALGRLVRGLSTLVWGLPATMLIYAATARADWFNFLDDAAFLPAMLASASLYFGLRQFHDFQKQERIWRQALHRAEFFAVINTGLCPFLFWWHRFPYLAFYGVCVTVLVFSVVLFLMQINQVLRRLCAMLPDEGLRAETKSFTSLNIALLMALFAGLAIYLALPRHQSATAALIGITSGAHPQTLWLVLFSGLMPLALTVALLWKIKEILFRSLFESS